MLHVVLTNNSCLKARAIVKNNKAVHILRNYQMLDNVHLQN